MGPATIKAKEQVVEVPGAVMNRELRFFDIIEHHRTAFLSSPFILAAILSLLYIFGPGDFRQVLDFMSPGHLLGR